MDWWLIIGTPDGIHCWPLGTRDPAPSIIAAKALLGVPAGAWPMLDGSAWDVQVAPGRPHDTLMTRATLHDLGDLAQVDVAAYQAAEAAAHRDDQIRAAKQVIDSMEPTTKAALLDTYGRVPTTTPKKAVN